MHLPATLDLDVSTSGEFDGRRCSTCVVAIFEIDVAKNTWRACHCVMGKEKAIEAWIVDIYYLYHLPSMLLESSETMIVLCTEIRPTVGGQPARYGVANLKPVTNFLLTIRCYHACPLHEPSLDKQHPLPTLRGQGAVSPHWTIYITTPPRQASTSHPTTFRRFNAPNQLK